MMMTMRWDETRWDDDDEHDGDDGNNDADNDDEADGDSYVRTYVRMVMMRKTMVMVVATMLMLVGTTANMRLGFTAHTLHFVGVPKASEKIMVGGLY